MLMNDQTFKIYKLQIDLGFFFHNRAIFTSAWTWVSCVKKQCDVGLAILLLATQPRLFDDLSGSYFA